MSLSGKDTENGRLYFGDKTANYLKRKSRAAVEKYHNAPILFFGIDWINSKKNFYGDITMKKFLNPSGVSVKGIYNMTQSPDDKAFGIPDKTMIMSVSVYTEHLEELNIEPQQGDYFKVGSRFYKIYSRSISDVGPGSLLMNREKMRRDYKCYEDDDESMTKNA
ncbi:MAG: hypothetical protein ABIP68_01825, partial [Ferruginibacter sp.]